MMKLKQILTLLTAAGIANQICTVDKRTSEPVSHTWDEAQSSYTKKQIYPTGNDRTNKRI